MTTNPYDNQENPDILKSLISIEDYEGDAHEASHALDILGNAVYSSCQGLEVRNIVVGNTTVAQEYRFRDGSMLTAYSDTYNCDGADESMVQSAGFRARLKESLQAFVDTL